jgi:cytochrome c
MKKLFLAVAAAGLLAAGSASAQDAAAGEKVFAKCKACHSNVAGKNMVGPSLFGIVGRQAGTVAGFNYSEANKNSGVTWTTDKLDTYLTDPKAFMPGNKMAFPGVKDDAERKNLIAYLETLK